MQEKTFSTKGATTKKSLGPSHSWAIQREERGYQMSLFVSHKLEKPSLPLLRHTYVPPTALPYGTVYSSWRAETLARSSTPG